MPISSLMWYLKEPMRDTQHRFQQLSESFDALVLEVANCKEPQLRIELLQRMKILIDEIDGLIYVSLNRDAQQARLTNLKLSPDSSAP